ncbi:MAG: hypothetical protein Q7R52_00180 [archaeon]|nr:hypothetical protein [archaeon]
MIEKELTYQQVWEYITLRQRYLEKYYQGMLRSKRKCGKEWKETDEMELMKIYSRKRELDSISGIIKLGKKRNLLSHHINKLNKKETK